MVSCTTAFSTFAQTGIPNPDFENWTSKSNKLVQGWTDNNVHSGTQSILYVTQVAGVTNSAIRLETKGTWMAIPGYIANTSGNAMQGQGGAPFSAGKPTHMKGYYRYNIISGDSAQIYVIFKKNGTILTRDSFLIIGTRSSFVPFSMPLSPLSVTPDSVVIFATSGIITSFPANLAPGSYLELDELAFSNGPSNYNLADGSFDNWPTVVVETCDDWQLNANAEKTTDGYSGQYAVKLTTKAGINGSPEAGELFGSTIPLNKQYVDTLVGYYKYSTPASDLGYIEVLLFPDHQNPPDVLDYTLSPAPSFTRFEIPLIDNDPAGDMSFRVLSSYTIPVNGSELIIDRLELRSGKPASVNDIGKTQFQVYPNPVKNDLEIHFENSFLHASVLVTDIRGNIVANVECRNTAMVSIPLAGAVGGMYFYEIRTGSDIVRGKIIKE